MKTVEGGPPSETNKYRLVRIEDELRTKYNEKSEFKMYVFKDDSPSTNKDAFIVAIEDTRINNKENFKYVKVHNIKHKE